MRHSPLFILLLSFFCSALSIQEGTWGGEWGVHLAPGVDPSFLNEMGFEIVRPIGNMKDTFLIRHASLTPLHSRALIHDADSSLLSHNLILFSSKQHMKRMDKRKKKEAIKFVPLPDPLFPNQWHLNNTGQQGGVVGEDVHVGPVWQMGYHGEGVRIAVVDDGYQYIHPDLAAGYQADSSYDFVDGDFDPSPGPTDGHGTSAAGVAVARNNSACGVGAAYMASGSGIRLLQDAFSDADVAAALTYSYDKNDIYSNSWGPYDDGVTVEGPGYFTKKAMEEGLANGRKKLGSIYVWAAGNGLLGNDNCNYDGYANHRGTIAVGAVDNTGKQSYYSEPCAAMLVTAPSSSRTVGITTTSLLGSNKNQNCSASFGGTSSACPLVAGIVALMLQANPNLHWRDVQFILLSTADKNDAEDGDWTVNGKGYHINHKYGFGRVNALKAVNLAKDFDSLPSAKQHVFQNLTFGHVIIPDNDVNGTSASHHIKDDVIVEQVEVTVFIPNFNAAGDLQIILTSPNGTKSIFSEPHGTYTQIGLTVPNFDPNAKFWCSPATFGPKISKTPITGNVVIPQPEPILCASDLDNITNCNLMNGNIVLVNDSSSCNYTDQVYTAQLCGAIAVVVAYEFDAYPPPLIGSNNSITIPSVMVDLTGAQTIIDQLANGEVSISIALYDLKNNISFDGWTFSTVRNWGERSKGSWTLQVIDSIAGDQGQITSWSISIYGHATPDPWLPPWALGIIIAGVVIVIFIISFILYRRSQRHGFQQLDQ